MLELTRAGFHGGGVDLDDVQEQSLRQAMPSDHARGAIVSGGRQLEAIVADDGQVPPYGFGECGTRVEVEPVRVKVGRRRRALLAQRPESFENLLDLLIDVHQLHSARCALPNHRDSHRVSRLGAGTSCEQ